MLKLLLCEIRLIWLCQVRVNRNKKHVRLNKVIKKISISILTVGMLVIPVTAYAANVAKGELIFTGGKHRKLSIQTFVMQSLQMQINIRY